VRKIARLLQKWRFGGKPGRKPRKFFAKNLRAGRNSQPFTVGMFTAQSKVIKDTNVYCGRRKLEKMNICPV
jgi:hypothetical protein